MTSPPKLESGQMVLLSTENIKFHTDAPKTLPLSMGPFPIQTFNHWFDNYTLDFSSEPSMTNMVNLFHISKLKEYKSRDRKEFPLPKLRNPEPVKENLYAAKALEFRTEPETGKGQYLIRWKGYSSKHDKWVYTENISNDILCAYWSQGDHKNTYKRRNIGGGRLQRRTREKTLGLIRRGRERVLEAAAKDFITRRLRAMKAQVL